MNWITEDIAIGELSTKYDEFDVIINLAYINPSYNKGLEHGMHEKKEERGKNREGNGEKKGPYFPWFLNDGAKIASPFLRENLIGKIFFKSRFIKCASSGMNCFMC